MQPLRAAPITAGGPGAVAWVQHVVRPLLCPPRGLGPAYASPARGHAGVHCAPPGCTQPCAGAGLLGSALSPAEQRIALRYGAEPTTWES